MNKLHTSLAATVGATLLLSGAALAQGQPQPGTAQAPGAQGTAPAISLREAIDKAGTAVGGNVVDAGLSDEDGPAAWEIELAQADGTVRTVLVDAQTGAIDPTSAMDDGQADRSDHQDRDGDHDGERSDDGDSGEHAN